MSQVASGERELKHRVQVPTTSLDAPCEIPVTPKERVPQETKEPNPIKRPKNPTQSKCQNNTK